MIARGVFVTGTDTGVGKTVASAALIHALRARGLAVAPMKPVAAGAVRRGSAATSEDTEILRAAAGGAFDRSLVTPVLLEEAIAPHIAAAREGRTIELAAIIDAFEALAARHFVVVEGVGGFCVPLGEGLDTVQLAQCLALPVVLVVGLRLGCLNHALLTAQAIDRAGLTLAGWIASCIDAGMPLREENIATLCARLSAPLLGVVPFAAAPDPAMLASCLDPAPFLQNHR
jgi:dethiobiotin synthetase